MDIQPQSFMNLTTLCRICLQENGKYHIFENLNIHSKLLLCMREKIEDIDGLPYKICEVCKNTLDTVCSFINKYKETSKVLNTSIFSIKQELSEEKFEVELNAVKMESDNDIGSDHEFAEILKPLQVQVKKVKLNENGRQMKKEPRKRVLNGKVQKKNRPTGKKKELGDYKKTQPKPNKQNQNPKKPTHKNIKENKKQILEFTTLCEQCGITFENAYLLGKHRSSQHEKKEKIKCDICQNTYLNLYYLNKHIKRMHGGEKKYSCPQCDKMCAFQSDLSAHVRSVHKKHLLPKKIYSCKFCNKQYKSSDAKTGHERTIHTGERPEICKVCGQTFSYRTNFLAHMRLHTGATPYKCPICGRGYAQCGNMKSHLRNHKISDLDEETLKKMKPVHLKYMRP